MSLPPVYSRVLSADHVQALEEAISASLDHVVEDLLLLQRSRKANWDELMFFNGLPPRYRQGYRLLFAKKFLTCLVVATHKMTDPNVHPGILACVAEELAAYRVLTTAENVFAARSESGGLPERIDFTPVYELLFEDLDFEMLYDPVVNGIEIDPASERVLGLANLRFEEWFEPFPGRHVHPILAFDAGRRGLGAV